MIQMTSPKDKLRLILGHRKMIVTLNNRINFLDEEIKVSFKVYLSCLIIRLIIFS